MEFTEALKLEGVIGYFGASDIPGSNIPGLQKSNIMFPDDTPIFADKKVNTYIIRYICTTNYKIFVQVESVGQVIGVIAANDVVLARRAAKLVKIKFNLLKPLTDFKEARETGSLHGRVQHYGKEEKELVERFGKAQKVLEGEVSMGGQEHYYLETQSSLVVPGEGDEL